MARSHLKVQPDLTRIDLGGRVPQRVYIQGAFDCSRPTWRKLFDLRYRNFRQSILVKTIFDRADLSGAFVYGIAAWDVSLVDAIQHDLIITDPYSNSQITLDNLEMAQFVHLLLDNAAIRSVIDTITSKVVLILGDYPHP